MDIFLRPDLSYEILLPDTEWIDLGNFSVKGFGNKQKLLSLKLVLFIRHELRMPSISNFYAAMSSSESIHRTGEANVPDQAAIAAIIAGSKPEDYDGHTEFHRLSPQARLEWLESAVRFIDSSRRAKNG